MEEIYKKLYKMQKVYLKGELAQFGEVWNMKVSSLRDVFKLISCQTPGFDAYLVDCYNNNMSIEIVKGKELLDPCVESLFEPVKDQDLIITLVPQGSDDVGQIFLAAAIFYTAGQFLPKDFLLEVGKQKFTLNLAAQATFMAFSLAVQGISAMMQDGPEQDLPEQFEEEQKAKLFNGPANVAKQGVPVPLLYGELVVGGTAIHSNLNIKDSVLQQKKFPNRMTTINLGGGN